MDRITIRYSAAAAAILITAVIAVSAMAESGQYQPPARPVDPNERLPGVIQFEQFLNKNGITGLNTVKGRPAPAAPSHPEPVAQPSPAAEPVAQPVQSQPAPVVLSAPPVAEQPAPVTRREPVAPASAQIPASSSASQALAVEDPVTEDTAAGADSAAPMPAPAQDASILYAPPVRPPWWERLLSSRGFLYAAAFCLIAVPAGAFAASAVMGRRREERDLVLYD